MEHWHADFGMSLARMMVVFGETHPHAEIGLSNYRSSVLPDSRNVLAQSAINDGATHILYLDSDMMFPPDLLNRLLAHGREIVAVNYVRRTVPTVPTAFIEGEGPLYTEDDDHGLVEVSHCGMGAMLIRCDVFDGMPMPLFQFIPRPGSPNMLGEDVLFCSIARERGHKIMIDQDLSREIGHLGQFIYSARHGVVSKDKVKWS